MENKISGISLFLPGTRTSFNLETLKLHTQSSPHQGKVLPHQHLATLEIVTFFKQSREKGA